jgi:hypothetical protein
LLDSPDVKTENSILIAGRSRRKTFDVFLIKATKHVNKMKPSIPKAGGVGELTGDGVDVTGYTGSVTLTIPIPATFCRGSEPDLYLTYDSNYENGVFGRGFRLSLPSIARDTSCRAPQYDETDTFVFSHTDKLVPALDQNGQLRRSSHGVAAATAYRPLV